MMSGETKKKLVQRLSSLQPGFIIGTGTSAHQVEGGNYNDWAEFERISGNIKNEDKSGRATDHYNLYDKDFKQLSDLGFKAQRISIEWSRVYPEEDEIDHSQVEHYRSVLKSLKNNNLISFVTLHHFTSPVWFTRMGGFLKEKNLSHWKKFVRTIAEELGDLIDVFNTINEPYVYGTTAYLDGIHAPGKTGYLNYMKVGNNIMRAHFQAVEIIREVRPNTPVGIVKNLIHFKSKGWSPINKIMKFISDLGFNMLPIKSMKWSRTPFSLRKIPEGDIGDFVGINYYVQTTVGLGLPGFVSLYESGDENNLTQMGWGVYPEGMKEEFLRFAKNIDLPIIITENGIATDDDTWRIEYINDHLNIVADLLEEGIDIRGYLHWSSIDNFEWAEGYEPKFGLISFDPKTFERTPKPSAHYLGDIADQLFQNRDILDFR